MAVRKRPDAGEALIVDPEQIYDNLQAACKMLEHGGDHAIAAMVSHCMAMVQDRYGVGRDHLGGDDALPS